MESSDLILHENQRTRVRTAGLHGDYWYPVEMEKNLRPGETKEVIWWKQSIALFRDDKGGIHAVENRCAHRQLKLTLGQVEGCNLVCEYHGWQFNGDGRCVHIPHEIKSKSRPEIKIRSYPVKSKYGIIWLFPGDPERANQVPLPACKPLDGPDAWPHVPLDFTWKSHHSMILENVCDFYHEYLHRKYKPFYQPKLAGITEDGDKLTIEYDASFSESQIVKLAGDKKGTKLDRIQVFFDYPYQSSNIDNKYLHWMFLLPIDETTTRAFFLFAFGGVRVPVIDWELPRALKWPALHIANLLYVKPLLEEDGRILEAEMAAHHVHKSKPVYEFNPVVKKMQAIAMRRWDDWQEKQAARSKRDPRSLPQAG